jgi:putative holliday junction resolvase
MLKIQTVMGFDFGMRHIGVAIGQALMATSQPCTSLSAKQGKPDWPQLIHLVNQWNPDALIVGVPFSLEGQAYEMTWAAQGFLKELAERFTFLHVFAAEERLTTVEARARLFSQGGYKSLKKQSIDSLAAQLIVESWLCQNTHFK